MSKLIATIGASIVAKTAQFEKGLARARAASNRFQKSVVGINRKLKKIGKQAEKVGKQMTIGLSAPIALLGVAAVKTFADFEQEMAKVKAVSGATGKEFTMLKDLAEDLGESTRFTASQVASLQLNYSKLGFVPKQIEAMTKPTLELALATGEDLAQSAEVAGGILRAFGQTAENMPRVVDVMAKSFSSSALNLEKFKDAMKSAAPVSNAVGASLEETTAVISTMVDANIDASTAGTTLRNMFLELSNKGITWKQAMDKIKNSTDKAKTANDLFGKRAVAGALVIADNTDKIDRLTGAYNNSAGAAAEMASIMDDTLQGSMLKLQSAVEGMAISFGETLKPVIEKVVGFAIKLANRFSELEPRTKKIIVVVAGLVAAVGPLLVTLGFLASTVLPALVTGFALLTGPIGLAVIAIAVAANEIRRNWDGIVEYFTTGPAPQAWQTFNETTSKFFALINDNVSGASGKILMVWDRFIGAFIGPAKKMFNDLMESINTFFAIWGDVFDAFGAALNGNWGRFWEEMKSIAFRILASMVKGVTDQVSTLIRILNKPAEILDELAGTDTASFMEGIAKSVDGFAESIGAMAETTAGANDKLDAMRRHKKKLAAQTALTTAEVEKERQKYEELKTTLEEQVRVAAPPTQTTGGGLDAVGSSGGDGKDKKITNPFKGMDSDVKIFSDSLQVALAGLEETTVQADILSEAFGDTQVEALERQRSALKSVIEEQVKGNGLVEPEVQELIDRYDELGKKIEGIDGTTTFEKMAKSIEEVGAVATEIMGGISEAFSRSMENQMIRLDNRYGKEIEDIKASQVAAQEKYAGQDALMEASHAKSIANIENSTLSEEAKAVAIRKMQDANSIKEKEIIQARVSAEKRKADKLKRIEQELSNKKKAIKLKQAKLDKATALLGAIVNTARGVAGALPNIPLSVIVGAIGAAQIGTIAAAPIPAFAKGTDFAPGGMSLVGEKGPEIVNLPRGSQVIPNNKISNGGSNMELLTRITAQDIELILKRKGRSDSFA